MFQAHKLTGVSRGIEFLPQTECSNPNIFSTQRRRPYIF